MVGDGWLWKSEEIGKGRVGVPPSEFVTIQGKVGGHERSVVERLFGNRTQASFRHSGLISNQ